MTYYNQTDIFQYVEVKVDMMDSEAQTKVDPRKQALLEARFFGTGRENIEVSCYGDQRNV